MAQYAINVCLGNLEYAAKIYKGLSSTEQKRVSTGRSYIEVMESAMKDGCNGDFTCAVFKEPYSD